MASDADEPPPTAMTAHVPLLLFILTAGSVWIYLFTDWFPLFGSILGLGGVLIVVPAMQGLMAESRRKAYAALFDRVLFQAPWMAKVYLVILFAVVGCYVFMQPFRISATPGSRPIDVQIAFIASDGTKQLERMRIVADETRAIPIRQPFSFLGGPTEVQIVANGLPWLQRKIGSFDWPQLSLPDDFWSLPIVLMRAQPAFLEELQRRTPVLTLKLLKGTSPSDCTIPDYLGEPVWIAGGNGVIDIEDRSKQRWLMEARAFAIRNNPSWEPDELSITTPTRAMCFAVVFVGDEIEWKIKTQGDEVLGSGKFKIDGDISYPQEVLLSANKNGSQK